MNDSEHLEQVRLFAWAEWEETAHPELALLFAVPNGGKRDAVTGARLKAEGVKRGVPDVWLPVARGRFHGMVVEMKAGEGRATPEQRAWLTALESQGWYAVLARGSDEAERLILAYLEGMVEDSYER